jgi:hypothetical protein
MSCSLRSVLRLSHLCVGLTCGLSFLFPHQIPMRISAHPISNTCPIYIILLGLFTLLICSEVCTLQSSSLCSFLYPLITSYFSDPYIFLSTLFLNTVSLCSFLSARDQLSYPYKTTGKIIVFCILLCVFSDDSCFQMMDV